MRQAKLIPLYHQIYLTMRNELLGGHFHSDDPNTPLPGENDLADRYSVSRVTIRRALQALETEGLVDRRHGAGTFPTKAAGKPQINGDTSRFYDDVADLIHGYDQKIIAYERIVTPAFLIRQEIGFSERCLHLAVLSKRDGRPVHINHQYVPEDLGALLGKRRPKDVSLLLELRKHGVTAAITDLALTATAADLDAADHLDVLAGSPLISTTRLSRNADGTPLEYFEALTRPDAYTYRFQFTESDNGSNLRQIHAL